MSNNYFLSLEAERDIDEIVNYLLKESNKAADLFIDATYHAFEMIAEHPEIGHVREDLTPQPVRFWVFKWRYLVIYNPKNPIEIIRVLNSYRDIIALLN